MFKFSLFESFPLPFSISICTEGLAPLWCGFALWLKASRLYLFKSSHKTRVGLYISDKDWDLFSLNFRNGHLHTCRSRPSRINVKTPLQSHSVMFVTELLKFWICFASVSLPLFAIEEHPAIASQVTLSTLYPADSQTCLPHLKINHRHSNLRKNPRQYMLLYSQELWSIKEAFFLLL